MVTGIRFYKAATNTGTHVGSLWTSTGTLLARPRSPTRPPPAGRRSLLQPGRGHRRNDLRRVATSRPTATTPTPGRLQPRPSTTRRCTRSPTARQRQRRLRLQRREQRSRPTASTPATTGSTSCSRRRRPGPGHRRHRDRGPRRAATVTLDRAVERRPATTLHGHAVHRRDGADADDRHRHAAGDERDVTGLTAGHGLHVHRPGRRTPTAPGRRRRSPTRSRRPAPIAPSAPTGVSAQPGHAARRRSAGPRPRTTAAARSPATRSRRTSARTAQTAGPGRQRHGHVGDRHRADQRHRLHVQGDARPTPSAPARPRRPPPRSTPADTIFDFAHAAAVDARRRDLGRARREVHGRRRRARSPASASTRRRPTPARTSAACGRSTGTLLASATFTNETASGWQTVTFSTPVHDHRRHDLRRLATSRPTATTRSRRRASTRRSTNAPLHALAERQRAPTASTPTPRRSTFPTNSFNASNYWVDVLFAPTRRPGQVDQRDRDRRAAPRRR